MAATIKGVTTLVFGCDSITTIINQSIDSTQSGEITYVNDEDGDYVAYAVHGLGKVDISGEYMYKGADIVTALGIAVTLTVGSFGGLALVYELGRKQSNTGFVRGTFKAGGVTTVTA
jgi:hypothetical protein